MKISEYTELFAPDDTDYLVIVHAGVTQKVRLGVLHTSGGGGGSGGMTDPGANGIVIREATNITIARSLIAPAAGLAIVNPDGISGNPTFSLANDLAGLEALTGTGYPKRTAADTWALNAGVPAGDISGAQALTKTDDANVTIALGGSPGTALLAPASIALGWAGQLAVGRGGTGAAALAANGILYGGGTGAIQALAVNAAAGRQFLTQASGNAPAWAAISAADLPGNFSGFANPSALVGLATINGTATTAMRSDAAPALSQAITPTWSALHTFSAGISMNATKITNLAQAMAATDALAAGRTLTEGAGLAGNTYDLTANRTLALGVPSGLSVSSVNLAAGTSHAHAIATSSNPGAAAVILATDASGYLTTVRHTVTDYFFVNAATANLYLHNASTNPTGWQSSADLIVTPQANNSIRSTNFTSGLVGWSINAAGDAEFNNIVTRGELRASVFKVNEIAATGGTLGVFYSASTLHDDLTIPLGGGAFTFNAKNSDITATAMLFDLNHIVRIKAYVAPSGTIIADTWATITSKSNQGTYTTYGANFNSGSTNVTFRAGTSVVDYGLTGTGFITLSADGTVGPTPNLTMAKHAGSPWGSITTLLRIGNLNGAYVYSTDVYGIGLGQYGTANIPSITIEPTNGIRIFGGASGTSTIGQWDATGAITVGEVSAGKSNVNITAGALALRNNTTNRILLNADGSGFLANSAISWDTSGYLTVTNNATIAGWTISPTELANGNTHVVSNGTMGGLTGAWFGKSSSGYSGFCLRDNTGGVSRRIDVFAGDSGIYPYLMVMEGSVYRVVLGGLNYAGFPGGFRDAYGLKIGDSSGNLIAEFSSGQNYIAGWTCAAGYFVYDTGVASTSAGMAPADFPFYAGATYAGRASAPFRVTPAGTLFASNATITGTITATTGSIGGWTIGTSKISSTGIDILSGATAALAFGSPPPTSSTAGAGIWIDRTGLYGNLSSGAQTTITSAGLSLLSILGNAANILFKTSGIDCGSLGSISGTTTMTATGCNIASTIYDGVLQLNSSSQNASNIISMQMTAKNAGLPDVRFFGGVAGMQGVTIGTNAAPAVMLDVRGKAMLGATTGSPGASDKGILQIYSTDANVGLSIGSYSASPFGMWLQAIDSRAGSAGIFPIILNPLGGNIGIGMTGPLGQFQLGHTGQVAAPKTWTASSSNGRGLVIDTYQENASPYREFADFAAMGDIGSGIGGSVIRFLTNPTTGYTLVERMRIDNAGQVGIGTALPNKSGQDRALTINGATSSIIELCTGDARKGYLYFASSGPSLTLNCDSGDLILATGSASYIQLQSNGATRVLINSAGAVRFNNYGAGTLVTDASGNITASSDERLKFVEGLFARGLADLRNAGRPVYYKWRPGSGNETETRYVGWITQSLEAAIPEAVINGGTYQNLWDRAIHATMHNAILDLDRRDDSLQSQISALQLRVEQLEAQLAAITPPTT